MADYSKRFIETDPPRSASVELFKMGARITASSPGGQRVQPAHLRGVMRGKVKKFSFQSRRRLQDVLLGLQYDKGIMLSVCYTFPGVKLTDSQCLSVFDAFAKDVVKRGWCGIWRKEIQKRGMLHWHVWQGYPCAKVIGPNPFQMDRELKQAWAKACDSVGAVETDGGGQSDAISILPGFEAHAVQWSFNQDEGSADNYFRYMAAHSTKENYQVAEGRGRHWGIFGRKQFTRRQAELIRLTDEEYAEIMRRYNEASFGHRHNRHMKWLDRMLEECHHRPTDEQFKLIDIKAEALKQGLGGKGTIRIFGKDAFSKIINDVVDRVPF